MRIQTKRYNEIGPAKGGGESLGYAYYDEEKTTVQAAIEEADKMMYQNKR